jgi:3-hydroxyacyl-[acyl-carrier-protein] dehydratase
MANNVLTAPITDIGRILQLIPQKPPFVMVDTLREYTHLTGTMAFTIPDDNLLVKEGVFSEPGLIEHMAQSMSLHRGYRGFLEGLEKPQTGFIGAIKSVEIYELPKSGTTLTTYVEILQEVMKVTLVTARTENEKGEVIATSEMKTVTVD